MSYTRFTTTERVKIETYLELRMSIRSIARRLGQPSTVSREIRRNPDYVAERAQKRYEKAKTNCGAKNETRRHDAPDGRREAACDLVPGTDRRPPLRRKRCLFHHLPLDLCGTDRGKEFSGHERIQASLGVPIVFRRPVFIVATGEQRERQRAPQREGH